MSIKDKITSTADQVRLYWKKPPLGRYMPFKEIFSLSLGSMGIQFLVFCTQNMILSIGNTLIGNTIGIPPKPLYAIYIISVVASFPLMALRAQLIDNARSKKGKYRPFILYMGLPTAVLSVAFILMPYDRMSMMWKCITVLLYNIALQFFYMFYYDVDQNIINVLSPNTIERSDVFSIKSVVNSLAPTLGNLLLPILARAITGENTLVDIKIYRILYPPMIIGGFLLGLLVYFNTEEKIVQAKTHTVKIKFTDAFRAVMRNKYFWIISFAGWFSFLEAAIASLLSWLYSYQEACSSAEYSIVTAISGNASFWPMLFAPFLIRVLGKRKILISANFLNIVFIIMMLPIVLYSPFNKMIWLLLICVFGNYLAATISTILTPSINGDIRDYQQYITGERIDGMFAAVGVINSIVMLVTNSILPELYDRAGLNESVARSLGYDGSNVYEVLYNGEYFRQICAVLVVASAVGALFNLLPYFLYDLSELKQKAMVTVLKIRALFEDYGNNALSDEALVEAIDVIEEAKEYYGKEPLSLSKDKIRQARRSRDKEALKRAKEEYNSARETNEKIEVSKYVIKEINKFERPEYIAELEAAQKIVAAGLGGLGDISTIDLNQAKAMPKKTQDEKEIRNRFIDRARAEKYSKKMLKKHYPDGITEFDSSVFDKLFAAEDETEAELKKLYNILSSKDCADKKEVKISIEALKVKKAKIKKEIKKATNQNSIYTRAAKPYLDAQKLLIQKENYEHYEDIKAKYEESKQRAQQQAEQRQREEAEQKADREAYTAKLKAEKKALKRKK